VTRAEIQIAATVLAEIEAEAERTFPDESGGVLLGYAGIGEPDRIRIREQIGPGPRAVHKSHRFEPDGEWQAEQIAASYAASGRVNGYLGDWHSHPHGGGSPSTLDRSTARRIAGCAEARAPHPLILIAFGEPGNWRLAAYRRGRWRLHSADLTISEVATFS
jgi:integrative and conjugative element protein (TIGR02256 family)